MSVDITDSDYDDAAHLLRRTGFGGSPSDILSAAGKGLSATTEALLNYEATPDTIDDDAVIERLLEIFGGRRNNPEQTPTQVIKSWWAYRMLATSRPLQEKMTLFWHNHFVSSDQDGDLMIRQNQLYRKHALGNFRELVLAVTRDTEMLRYLNGNQNYKAHPNENYGRELMELFTCGRVGPDGKPNYTEDDVKAAARAFSGYNLQGGDAFRFNPGQHDDAVKSFMGRSGNFTGDDIVDILVSLPATGNYITRKLFRYLSYSDPEPEVQAALVRTYFDSGYEIRAVVKQILTSPWFYSPKARFALIKSPAEYVIGTIKMTGLTNDFLPTLEEIISDQDQPPLTGVGNGRRRPNIMARLTTLTQAMRLMGQDILAPPNVKGWDGGKMWLNTDSIQSRGKFSVQVSNIANLPAALAQSMPRSQSLSHTAAFNDNSATAVFPFDPPAMVDSLLYQLGPLPVSGNVRQALIDYASSVSDPIPRLRGTLSLVMGTSEYQMN